MAPPIFSKKDSVTGLPIKTDIGPWLITIMKIIAPLKFLRGTLFDPFGYLLERKKERELIEKYYKRIKEISSKLDFDNYKTAIKIASIPEKIRGFGYIKMNSIKAAENLETNLIGEFYNY